MEGRSGLLAAVASGVSALFDGLVAATPSIANVGALLFVLLYVYAALAVRLFGGLENAQFVHDCHFATFPDAAYCLFRVMSGDDWSRVAAETFGGCHLIAGFGNGRVQRGNVLGLLRGGLRVVLRHLHLWRLLRRAQRSWRWWWTRSPRRRPARG